MASISVDDALDTLRDALRSDSNWDKYAADISSLKSDLSSQKAELDHVKKVVDHNRTQAFEDYLDNMSAIVFLFIIIVYICIALYASYKRYLADRKRDANVIDLLTTRVSLLESINSLRNVKYHLDDSDDSSQCERSDASSVTEVEESS